MTEELAQASTLLHNLMARRQAARRTARMRPNGTYLAEKSRNRLIASEALVREPIPGGLAELWITYNPGREEFRRIRQDAELSRLLSAGGLLDPDALNGYVAFPKRRAPKIPQNDTGNIVQYIPVHGGVTYACKDSYAAVWGFDTQHCDSERQPRADRDWIRANCWVLYRGLLLAEALWPEFRRAPQPRRAEIADRLLALVEEQPLLGKLGFQAMIGTLFGRIG